MGETGSGAARLWEEGVAGRGSSSGGRALGVEAEAGYGLSAFGTGAATPYARFGQAEERRYGFGVRVELRAFALELEGWRREAARPEHGMAVTLGARW